MNYWLAQQDFALARRRAILERIVARLKGRPQAADLLSYDEVRQKLKGTGTTDLGLHDIPLDAIVGSVGRYADFTRSFLPRQDSDVERWSRVLQAVTNQGGVPPIDVYQIGDAYFVRDGNHRVSVARQMEASHIQARVTRVETRLPLSPDVRSDDLILKAEYTEFLERTDLDQVRPGADLSLTVPGGYEQLVEHIRVHRYYMGLEQKRQIPWPEAVAHWYDSVYLSVVVIIRGRGILRDFPERTEADLYLWVSEHRSALEKELGWGVTTGDAAADLAAEHSPLPRRVVARVGDRIRDAVTPDLFDSGPPPGNWRRSRLIPGQDRGWFSDILVAVRGDESGWAAVEEALLIAGREGGQLRGLHVVPSEDRLDGAPVQALRDEFDRRCREAGVRGELAVEVGRAARRIADRARWTDLVVVSLAHPPARQRLQRLGSGFRNLLLWSPRPVLAVPDAGSTLHSALLAYDGSRKAHEALFVAAYLAGRWSIPLVVASAQGNGQAPEAVLAEAEAYLVTRGVSPSLVALTGGGRVSDAILQAAADNGCDLILVGSYGRGPAIDAVAGSSIDGVLRGSRWPTWICR